MLDADGLFILSAALAATPRTPAQVPASLPFRSFMSVLLLALSDTGTHPTAEPLISKGRKALLCHPSNPGPGAPLSSQAYAYLSLSLEGLVTYAYLSLSLSKGL